MEAQTRSSIIEKQPEKQISWETFQKIYLTREDKYKYEWVNGFVEKTLRTIDKKQFYFQRIFNKFLHSLSFEGEFIAEGDTFFAGVNRRPDLALYSEEQLHLGKADKLIVPEFVIEIISTHDQMNKVNRKMNDYRKAKVKVIWQVFPETEEVHVFHGKSMQVCTGEDLCSAELAVKGFVLSVNDIFK